MKINAKITNNPTSINTLISQNPDFKEKYSQMKQTLLQKTDDLTASIETWIKNQQQKIAGSKNVIDNLSKYAPQKNTAHYIDKKE